MANAPEKVREVLARCAVRGNLLELPDQLDRKLYVAVNKVLEASGGKWSRKAKAHVFPTKSGEEVEGLIRSLVEDGSYVDRKKDLHFFQTPEPLAKRMAKLARIDGRSLVLEPSAGYGSIVDACLGAGAKHVHAVEIDPENGLELARRYGPSISIDKLTVFTDDFMRFRGAPAGYDAVVMNPPFRHEVEHVMRAWCLLKPGGRLIAICSPALTFHQQGPARMFGEWAEEVGAEISELPAGTFKESGTSVRAVLLTATKEAAAERPTGTASTWMTAEEAGNVAPKKQQLDLFV